MAYGERKNALLERISKIGQWIGVPANLKQDLVQEAWILCSEYALGRKKSVETLSNTEIRLRCFEARRKVLPPTHEVCVEDVAEFESDEIANNDSYRPGILEELMRDEEMQKYTSNFETLQLILAHHPTLKFTEKQITLWDVFRDNPRGRWKAEEARKLGVTRQNVTNIVGALRKKVEMAADLVRLWDGDVIGFFEKYRSDLSGLKCEKILWSMMRSSVSTPVLMNMQKNTVHQVSAMLDCGRQVICQLKRPPYEMNIPADRFVVVFHLLRTAWLAARLYPAVAPKVIDTLETLTTPGLLLQLKHVAFRKMLPDELNHQCEIIKYNLLHLNEGSAIETDIFSLLMLYNKLLFYNMVSYDELNRYIQNNGNTVFTRMRMEGIITFTYVQFFSKKYNYTTKKLNFNFLRLLLIFKSYRPDFKKLPTNSRNALITICQKSLHSQDAFVVSQAERLLRRL